MERPNIDFRIRLYEVPHPSEEDTKVSSEMLT
jgi:hypothetical protein